MPNLTAARQSGNIAADFNFYPVSKANNGKCFMLNPCISMMWEVRNMAKCPDCGKDVKTAKKSWKMAGKPDKAGKRTQLTIGLFECCGKTFRQVLEKKKI